MSRQSLWTHWQRWRQRRGRPGAGEASRRASDSCDRWRCVVRNRAVVAATMFSLWAVGIQARLVYLQVIDRAELAARAERQQQRTVDAPAQRGEIVDRHGRLLAYSVDADSVYAVPTEIEDPQRTATELCNALQGCSASDREMLVERLGSSRGFVWVRRQLAPDESARVAALGLRGIGFSKETRRYYPGRELAAHLLGFVGIDNEGLAGIEGTYDREIRGRDGRVLIQVDARRHAVASRVERAPTAGADLELTIDEYIQYVAERELRAGVEANRARGGSVVVMDPMSGQILALANWPTFNPNTFQHASPEARRNRAIQDLYEPGSTFKIVTASAALQEHVVRPDDLINTNGGMIRFGSRQIDDTHDYGVLSFTDVIVKSSNVGAIKVGLRIGAKRLDRYVRRFGFGSTLSSDFRGESPGIVWNPAELDDSALASVSMGYQIGVTALQMATAASAVANGGELIEPRVVRAVVRSGRRTEVPKKVIDRAVTPGTAATLTSIMELVVERGTGKPARVSGFTVAGKTGTARKLVDGRYSTTDYNASFVGFVPSRRPALAIVVVVDSPHAKGYYASVVAAPIFARVAEAALRHLGVPPTINPVPPLLVARRPASDPAPAPTPVKLATPPSARPVQVVPGASMPDLRGVSAREALRMLAGLGYAVQLVGNGVVVDQVPRGGAPLERGGIAIVHLGRPPANGDGS